MRSPGLIRSPPKPQFPYQPSGAINSAAAPGEACSTDTGVHVEDGVASRNFLNEALFLFRVDIHTKLLTVLSLPPLNSVPFCTFTRLYNRPLCLVPRHLYDSQGKPRSHETTNSRPHPSPPRKATDLLLF